MHRAPVLAAAILLVVPASARADEAVAELGRTAPVAAYGGWEAWSAYDEANDSYALMLRSPHGEVQQAEVVQKPTPWDVALGPDARGRIVAIYARCGGRDCGVRRFDVTGTAARGEELRSIDSGGAVESSPAIWRSIVVFTRRIGNCDVPYVKDLRSSAPSRRLLHATCAQTRPGHVSIRGTRIVISSVATRVGRRVSELRRYSSEHSGSKVLLRQGFGEDSNLFGQVSQDERFATTVRYGFRPDDTFVRVSLATGRVEEVNAFRCLTGAYARAAGQLPLYVELQGDPGSGCDRHAVVPSRLVAASGDPFGSVVRPLTPELDIFYDEAPRSGQPLAFSGLLSRRTSAGGEFLGGRGIPGVAVELHRRVGLAPERFEPTGLTATTGANGQYRIVVPDPDENPYYTAVAATPGVPTWAGGGTPVQP